MKETIYLIVSGTKVERMVKTEPSLQQLKRGEIPVKLLVSVEPKAFRTPVVEKEVYVEDWREGVDIADVDFKRTAITKEEADLIRQRRLQLMAETLETQGYVVRKIEGVEEEG